jgi:hypothetical protein
MSKPKPIGLFVQVRARHKARANNARVNRALVRFIGRMARHALWRHAWRHGF